LVSLEAALETAKATLAAAETERDRGVIRAPWDGVVSDLSVEVGKAALSFMGADLLTRVSLDPMLAVVEVSERKLSGVKVGDPAEVRLVTGETVKGKNRFVQKTPRQSTRPHRVEAQV